MLKIADAIQPKLDESVSSSGIYYTLIPEQSEFQLVD